jgi:hypothetical protein
VPPHAAWSYHPPIRPPTTARRTAAESRPGCVAASGLRLGPWTSGSGRRAWLGRRAVARCHGAKRPADRGPGRAADAPPPVEAARHTCVLQGLGRPDSATVPPRPGSPGSRPMKGAMRWSRAPGVPLMARRARRRRSATQCRHGSRRRRPSEALGLGIGHVGAAADSDLGQDDSDGLVGCREAQLVRMVQVADRRSKPPSASLWAAIAVQCQ